MLTILSIICILLTVLYAGLMLSYRRGWEKQQEFTVTESRFSEEDISVTIVIPARNEAANIGKCIASVLQQDYPPHLYEVIVIDDHSSDDTAAIVSAFNLPNVRCLKLADYLAPGEILNAYKKKALATGIANSTGELIITTDADCTVPPFWLRTIVSCYRKERPVMIIAPVDFTSDESLLQLFQSIDFMSMQGITVASHILKMGNMCNGANLAFSRSAFYEVNGYKGTEHLASGDDYLLMMKMQQHFPGCITCLKSPDAIVSTAPQPSWKGFLQQRIRWSSKSGKYDDKNLTAVLILVYLFNLSFVPLLFFAGWLQAIYLLLAMLTVKTAVELYYLWPVSLFFKKRKQLAYYPLLQPLHIAYIVLAGFLGMAGVYQWKGRSVK
ncbi:glycosyltransferase [Chitinophagaceae bacterium MMS25-I14]